MPLGIISAEELDKELNRFNEPKSGTISGSNVVNISIGRGHKNEVPDGLRKVIQEESIEGTSSKELQRVFDVSASSISAYANGATSTASYNKPDNALRDHGRKVRDRIVKKARGRLTAAIDGITDQKLEECKARDLASIAKDMASVVKSLEPEIEETKVAAQFIFFAPKIGSEADYPIIDVHD